MILDGFSSIPIQSTAGGAPIDAFHADALRTNDQLFERIAQALLASPFVPNGADGEPTGLDLDPRKFINAKTIVMGAPKTVDSKVPLIWYAREKIVINENISAKGKGAVPGKTGDFGGSGGGTGGAACLMPFTNEVIVQGGDPASSADAWKKSRVLLYLPYLIGGAGGPATSGGSGGGVVCLCAPVIEIRNSFKIDASGADGTDGGGGGGLVILIARQLININIASPVNVLVNGGTAAVVSDNGGAGRFLPLIYK